MSRDFSFLKIAFATPTRLSNEEELELVKAYQAGDPQAYNKLRIAYRDLIEQVISTAIPSGNSVSPAILRMRAVTYLPQILAKYELGRGAKVSTYVTSQLKGYMKNAVRETMSGPYVPRNQHDDLNRYKQAIREAEMNFGNNPTESQIRSFYPTGASTSFDKIKKYHVSSLLGDAVFGNEDDDDAMLFKDQFVSDDEIISDDDLFNPLYQEEQDSMISQEFSPEEQRVIDLVIKQGQPFVQVALTTGLSTADIRKIMRRWHSKTQ